jgi:hypothetical protein
MMKITRLMPATANRTRASCNILDTGTGKIKVLLDGKGGGIRDPHVHYDGRTVLFSYRRSGTDCYNLHEIQTDGTGLRQVTGGPYDDIEAMYATICTKYKPMERDCAR